MAKKYNPEDYELYAIVARSPSGSTAVMELVYGREKVAAMAQELIESDHAVRIYACVEKDFEVTTKVTVVFADEKDEPYDLYDT